MWCAESYLQSWFQGHLDVKSYLSPVELLHGRVAPRTGLAKWHLIYSHEPLYAADDRHHKKIWSLARNWCSTAGFEEEEGCGEKVTSRSWYCFWLRSQLGNKYLNLSISRGWIQLIIWMSFWGNYFSWTSRFCLSNANIGILERIHQSPHRHLTHRALLNVFCFVMLSSLCFFQQL